MAICIMNTCMLIRRRSELNSQLEGMQEEFEDVARFKHQAYKYSKCSGIKILLCVKWRSEVKALTRLHANPMKITRKTMRY